MQIVVLPLVEYQAKLLSQICLMFQILQEIKQLLCSIYRVHLMRTGHFAHFKALGCCSRRHPRESLCSIYYKKDCCNTEVFISSVPCSKPEPAPCGPACGWGPGAFPGAGWPPARARRATAPAATNIPQPLWCWLPVSEGSLQLK